MSRGRRKGRDTGEDDLEELQGGSEDEDEVHLSLETGLATKVVVESLTEGTRRLEGELLDERLDELDRVHDRLEALTGQM